MGVFQGALTRRSTSAATPSIGTPYCLTVDHQSLEDGTITLRDRDSLAQERLPIEGIAEEVERRVSAPWKTPKLGVSTERVGPGSLE